MGATGRGLELSVLRTTVQPSALINKSAVLTFQIIKKDAVEIDLILYTLEIIGKCSLNDL